MRLREKEKEKRRQGPPASNPRTATIMEGRGLGRLGLESGWDRDIWPTLPVPHCHWVLCPEATLHNNRMDTRLRERMGTRLRELNIYKNIDGQIM